MIIVRAANGEGRRVLFKIFKIKDNQMVDKIFKHKRHRHSALQFIL